MMNPQLASAAGLAILLCCASQQRAWANTAAPLEIGVLPNISARVLLAQYQPMREYLARELQRPVQVSTAPNWKTFNQRTLHLDYDLIVTAANLARVAQLERGYVPLLAYAPKTKALLICASARPLKDLDALRGKTLVFANPQSLVALRGIQWLAENGLQRDKDLMTITTPTDDSVGSVVVRGDAVAAIISGGEYRAIPDPIKAQLQVVTTFAEVAGFVFLASPRLSGAQAQAIKAQLKRFASSSDEGKSFFASSGFNDLTEPEPGLMESMDPYVEATRQSLLASD
jgi:phosphonate transport system substrate-binding protein